MSIAEELLAQEIHANANDFTSYANRSFVMARKHDLDHALEDAIKVRWTHSSSLSSHERLTFIRDIVNQR
jgi:hypothetical protein